MPELPTWLNKLMTPLAILVAFLSVINQVFDFVSQGNALVVGYAVAIAVTGAWVARVFTARTPSVIQPEVKLFSFDLLTRTTSVIAFLTLVAVVSLHFRTVPEAFVLQRDVADGATPNLKLLDIAVTEDGFDLKFKNSGTDSAFIHQLWLLVDDAVYHPTPCMMPVPFSATYEYPFSVSVGNSSVDLSKTKPVDVMVSGRDGDRIHTVAKPSTMFSRRLLALLERSNRNDALEGMYWAQEPIEVSQAVAPNAVDRFLVRLSPTSSYVLGDHCDGGLHYDARIVVVYDKTGVVVSDKFDFTLAGGTRRFLTSPFELPATTTSQ